MSIASTFSPTLMKPLDIRLVKLLAIPPGCPNTAAKWLVIFLHPRKGEAGRYPAAMPPPFRTGRGSER